MQNQTVRGPLHRLQQKMDAFQEKIALHQSLTQSLAAEFESITAEFESLKYLLADSLTGIESLHPSPSEFAAASLDKDSPSSNLGNKPPEPESSTINKSISSGELVALTRRAAKEKLGIHYLRPDIPGRMAKIVLALKKQERITVAELRQITGVSRNTLVRDIKTLKLLGWLEFHGSRKNGYFTLSDLFPGFQA